jgi:hypothetical protein
MKGRSLNGSGEWLSWQEEEGGMGVILPSAFSPGWCFEPRLKAGGNYCRMELLGAPPFVTVHNTNRD